MSKSRQPPVPFPVQANATTAGPEFVRTITSAARLEALTVAVVLDQGGARALVFRKSTMAPGELSREEYALSGGGWSFVRKISGKITMPEHLGRAHCREVDGVAFYTLEPIPDEHVEALRGLLAIKPYG